MTSAAIDIEKKASEPIAASERHAQHAVAGEVARAVAQPPAVARGAGERARVATCVHARRAQAATARKLAASISSASSRAPAAASSAAEQRPGGHPRVAGALHEAVGAPGSCAPAAAGISADSGGRLSAVPAPSSALSARIGGQRAGRERERDRGDRLGERDRDEQARVLDAVGEAAGEAGERDARAEQREEERRDGVGRAGGRLDVQRERHPDEEVADRRQADGRHEQADVAEGEGAHVA